MPYRTVNAEGRAVQLMQRDVPSGSCLGSGQQQYRLQAQRVEGPNLPGPLCKRRARCRGQDLHGAF